jgi:hypothetical protein
MLSQEDLFSDYFDAFRVPMDPTANNLQAVRAFCLEMWQARYREMSSLGILEFDSEPIDLKGSCKFTSIFGSVVFGADISGNDDHVFNVLDDGSIFDINAFASDVVGKNDIYRQELVFVNSDPDLRLSLESCVPRVTEWINEFARRLDATRASAIGM